MIHFQNLSIHAQRALTWGIQKLSILDIKKSLIKKMICAMVTDTVFSNWSCFFVVVIVVAVVQCRCCCQFQFCVVFWLQAFREFVWTAFHTHTSSYVWIVHCATHYQNIQYLWFSTIYFVWIDVNECEWPENSETKPLQSTSIWAVVYSVLIQAVLIKTQFAMISFPSCKWLNPTATLSHNIHSFDAQTPISQLPEWTS